MFKSFNEPSKRNVVNYLFQPNFRPQDNRPIIISESGIGIEIIYFPTVVTSQAQNILVNNIGNDYVIPDMTTKYYIPYTIIGRICFNNDEEPTRIPHPNAHITNFHNSIPLIPANQQIIYQKFDRLLIYVTSIADDWAFLLRIIKERP